VTRSLIIMILGNPLRFPLMLADIRDLAEPVAP
jgi:hypothetical protein